MNILKRISDKLKANREPKEVEFKPLNIDSLILYYESKVKKADKDAGSRRNRRSKDPEATRKVETVAMLHLSTLKYLRELKLLKSIR